MIALHKKHHFHRENFTSGFDISNKSGQSSVILSPIQKCAKSNVFLNWNQNWNLQTIIFMDWYFI